MSLGLPESEEDTKLRRITPALKQAGWSSNSIWTEYSLSSGYFKIVPDKNETTKIPPQRHHGRVDYLLCHNANCPLCVIEAKRFAKSARDGIDQAIAYARLLDLPFAYASAGECFLERNLVTGATRELKLNEFPSPARLWQMYCEARQVPADRTAVLDKSQYYTSDSRFPRYYQMVAINKVVNAIIADKRKRCLLVMATGTGKTYVAFQIIWRLRKSGLVRNILYLADRNQLIDQSMIGDFQPLEKIFTKIQGSTIKKSHSLYFGLYQQLKSAHHAPSSDTVHAHSSDNVHFPSSDTVAPDDGDDEIVESVVDKYKQLPRDYFDLIVVDECHRGSAKEESSWREILEYFASAIQIGLTATPVKNEHADNAAYFGEPLYTYSLKQGIADGFLAPFQVVRVYLDKDQTGWEPLPGEVDAKGQLIEPKLYTITDFDRTLILTERTKTVATYINKFLSHIGPMSKTIVFCKNQEHAARMRDAIRECNRALTRREPNYCVRMTANDEEGCALFSSFISVSEPYPVVVTTSKLLSTGADTKCVKLIVIDTPIRSMIEFKQIIGRGTRLREEEGKTFFTILDFQGACDLFADPDFDGEPDQVMPWGIGDPDIFKPKEPELLPAPGEPRLPYPPEMPEPPQGPVSPPGPDSPKGPDSPYVPLKKKVYVVNQVEVTVQGSKVSYLDEHGKLVETSFRDYTKRNIRSLYETEEQFRADWLASKKAIILDKLAAQGVLLDELRKELHSPDSDEFDLICELGFDRQPLTRYVRAQLALQEKQLLAKYQGQARQVLEMLVEIYLSAGISEIENNAVLQKQEFQALGGPVKIMQNIFKSKQNYLSAIKDLEQALYGPDQAESA